MTSSGISQTTRWSRCRPRESIFGPNCRWASLILSDARHGGGSATFHGLLGPANQSCGLALAFSHRAVRRGGIQMIKLPSPELGISGRAAAIRVRRRQQYDFCIFSLCWPTGVRQNESGFRSLASWIGTVLQDLPGRCLPILCGDFNAKFTYDASRGSVGPCGEQVASPSWLSRIWLDVADRFQLVAANTFAPAGAGPTWFSGSGTTSSRIDYIWAPANLLHQISYRSVWLRTGIALQRDLLSRCTIMCQ